MGEARLRTLFELSSGESASGNRIGKGGRYPGDVNPNGDDEDEDEKPARKAKPAAQGKPVPAAVSGSSSVLTATLKQLQARLDGKTIQIIREEGGKPEKIKVKNVSKRTKDGELHFSDMAGKSRVIMLEHLKGVSK
jgi:hypothetical protein